jgi:hypothetical protein
MDLRESAELLGTTSEAIRKRAKRGTIPSEKGEDGLLYVWVDDQVDSNGERVDARVDEQVDGESERADDAYKDVLLERMGSEIEHLREQLNEEREANRENRRIIAGLVQRMPELEASPERRESPETATERRGNGEEPQEQQQRSWVSRFFFGP